MKKYRLYNPPAGTPEIELNGKPTLWGMLGPLPDNVIEYIRKNQKQVVNFNTGELALHQTNKEPFIKPIVGKNKDWYFFDELNKNWWSAHIRFEGKAVVLTPREWNEIFE
jgi:hypothetical protein